MVQKSKKSQKSQKNLKKSENVENNLFPLKKMLFCQFCQLRRLVFDQSSTVHPVSESRGGGGLSLTANGRSMEILVSNIKVYSQVSSIYMLEINIFTESALWADSVYKSKCLSVCPSVRLCVYPSVCVFTFEVLFKRVFAPTS